MAQTPPPSAFTDAIVLAAAQDFYPDLNSHKLPKNGSEVSALNGKMQTVVISRDIIAARIVAENWTPPKSA